MKKYQDSFQSVFECNPYVVNRKDDWKYENDANKKLSKT